MIPNNPTGTASLPPPKSASQSFIRGGRCYEKKEARVSGAFLGTPKVENLKFGLNERKRLFRLITTVQKIIET